MIKNLLASAGDIETQIRSLDWEDPLEDGIATPPICLPGEFHARGT